MTCEGDPSAQTLVECASDVFRELSAAGREALAGAELSAVGRQYVDTALRRTDELTAEIGPVRRQLITFARREVGCQALQARQYGLGWLCAAIMWAEIGDARRFHSSDQLVRFAGMDVTVYCSDGKRSPGASVPAGLAAAAVGHVRGG
jgi:transposase